MVETKYIYLGVGIIGAIILMKYLPILKPTTTYVRSQGGAIASMSTRPSPLEIVSRV